MNAATGTYGPAQDERPPKLTIAAALAIEARALEKGLTGTRDVRVVRVGQRARNAVRVLPRDDDALIVAGVAGGVAPHVRAGDIVVATEVRGPEGSVVRSPAAPLLAAALRALKLTGPNSAPVKVHLGPIATTDRLALGSRRRVLASEGVAAVDLESSWLGTLANRPFAVVRVIVDDSETGLYHPATVSRGRAAIQMLSRIVPALERWSDAISGRRVVLASPRSFCAGVERAIEIVEEALERYGAPVYVRRQIVHNAYVVADLERRGAVFVEELDEVPDGVPVVLSAHGVAPAVREDAARRGLAVVDATCPLVAKVHTEARRALRDGNAVVFIGHANHDESEGLLGEDPDPVNPRIHLVQTAKQAKELEVEDPARLAYLMQTTLAEDEAQDIVTALRATFPGIIEPPSSDICYATTNRQRAIRDIAAETDVVLVVGSQNSSNSKRLVEVAERAGAAAYLIDGADEIDPAWLVGARSVGLTAGASAPPKLVDEVADALSGLGPVHREEPPGVEESYKFALPPMPPLTAARRNADPDARSEVDADLDTGVSEVSGVTGVVNGPEVSAGS
ncbi:MAG TPA: 4-hydroxy-3-methylbut-2-enyl diphosphate reductase [Actinocrinis sp.]|uniref:4-hydroxy-3-methylbut-2-enyl diphosphate reductase n=1 Tax=Actinocrinis sp. TaxID=1920516 RepID=UPI002DDD6AF6|nr:4-hydroxy-3-methylbut-2-enyl diphosphate reductase [Actinocrinis sp.]HEV2346139.1 4-hydroxy-3-methylbut-2-enyl diphosphate reductase [Actinocrinis sp.]